jgi:hypothetical protein
LVTLSNLRYLHIGSSAQVESIDTLSRLGNLVVLEIENFKRIIQRIFVRAMKRREHRSIMVDCLLLNHGSMKNLMATLMIQSIPSPA